MLSNILYTFLAIATVQKLIMSGVNDINGEEIKKEDWLKSGGGKYFTCDVWRGVHVIVHEPTCRVEEEGACRTDDLDDSCVDFYKLVKIPKR